jgi:hypothetical protein
MFFTNFPSQSLQWLQLCLSQPFWNDIPDFSQQERTNLLNGLAQVKDKRRFKALIRYFSEVVNGKQTCDVFLAYTL